MRYINVTFPDLGAAKCAAAQTGVAPGAKRLPTRAEGRMSSGFAPALRPASRLRFAGLLRGNARRRMPSVALAEEGRNGGPVAQWLEPAAHNGLVGGSSPPGPTTQSA